MGIPLFVAFVVEAVRCQDCGASQPVPGEAEAAAWARTHNTDSPTCRRMVPEPGVQWRFDD